MLYEAHVPLMGGWRRHLRDAGMFRDRRLPSDMVETLSSRATITTRLRSAEQPRFKQIMVREPKNECSTLERYFARLKVVQVGSIRSLRTDIRASI